MPILEMTVNGKAVTLQVDGLRSLADVLREELGLTGTKIGCREGECGERPCSVLAGRAGSELLPDPWR